jgi:hypothetical protein
MNARASDMRGTPAAALASAGDSSDRIPDRVRLELEGARRGFDGKHAKLNFRRWCKRHGVTVTMDLSRHEWVRPADVDAALAKLDEPTPAPPPMPAANDSTDAAVRQIMQATR